MEHSNLYIVDNADDEQSVKKYLREWCPISKQMDIATGYLEIGGFLSLDSEWQKLDKIRIILGNEMTKRTKDVIDKAVDALLGTVKSSIDQEQEKNEFLIGVPAILDALKTRKIECRVFDKSKFHAKAYITYFRDEYKSQFPASMNVPDGYALVGSSNFTRAGLTQNIELNVQIRDDVDQLQNWFEEHWNKGEDITEAMLNLIEMHCKEYSPYEVYVRSMYEFFKSRQETISEWENHDSVVYKGLSQYQKDGYNSLVEIANRYSGAFLCDGVGLGKTFVGLMLIERFVKKERKNVVLMVPAAARVYAVIDAGEMIHNYRRISRGWKEFSRTDNHYREGTDISEFTFRGKKIMVGLCGDLWDYPERFKTDNLLIWPVYVNFGLDEWNQEILDYAEQAAGIADDVLMINPIDNNPVNHGGSFYFHKGELVERSPFDTEKVLIIKEIGINA